MAVVCGETEKAIENDIETDVDDEKHRKRRYICGEIMKRGRMKEKKKRRKAMI